MAWAAELSDGRPWAGLPLDVPQAQRVWQLQSSSGGHNKAGNGLPVNAGAEQEADCLAGQGLLSVRVLTVYMGLI